MCTTICLFPFLGSVMLKVDQNKFRCVYCGRRGSKKTSCSRWTRDVVNWVILSLTTMYVRCKSNTSFPFLRFLLLFRNRVWQEPPNHHASSRWIRFGFPQNVEPPAVFSGSSSLLLAFCQIGFGFKKGPDAVLDLGTGFGTNFGRPIAFLLRKGAENRCQNWDPQLEI